MTNQLSVGTRIYRPARLVEHGPGVEVEMETPSMKDFGDGTIMLRAAPREAYLPDWLAVDWETAGGRVCVCDEPIPDDWTYFEVFFSGRQFCGGLPRGRRPGGTAAQAPCGRGPGFMKRGRRHDGSRTDGRVGALTRVGPGGIIIHHIYTLYLRDGLHGQNPDLSDGS